MYLLLVSRLLQGLVFFKLIRGLFDFNFFLEPADVRRLDESYEKQNTIHLGDLILLIGIEKVGRTHLQLRIRMPDLRRMGRPELQDR
jgi:hypothetical protein